MMFVVDELPNFHAEKGIYPLTIFREEGDVVDTGFAVCQSSTVSSEIYTQLNCQLIVKRPHKVDDDSILTDVHLLISLSSIRIKRAQDSKLPGTFTSIAARDSSKIWGLIESGKVYSFNWATKLWKVHEKCSGLWDSMAVSTENSVWTINRDDHEMQFLPFDGCTECGWTRVFPDHKAEWIAPLSDSEIYYIEKITNVLKVATTVNGEETVTTLGIDYSVKKIFVGPGVDTNDVTLWGIKKKTNELHQFSIATSKWTRVPMPNDVLQAKDVSIESPTNIIVVMYDGSIYKTVDKGLTWNNYHPTSCTITDADNQKPGTCDLGVDQISVFTNSILIKDVMGHPYYFT